MGYRHYFAVVDIAECDNIENMTYDDYEYDFQKKEGGVGKYRVVVTQPKDWIIDKEAANRYLDLFGKKYHKAAKHFREKWAM